MTDPQASRPATDATTGRLALVLTEPGVQGVVSEVLRARRFAVRRAVDAATALAKLAADPFDLVVLGDDPAGGLDAAELTLALRRPSDGKSRRAWVLAIAPRVVAKDVARLRNAGVSGLLVGRITLGRLEERVALMDRDARAFIDHAIYVGPDRRVATDAFPSTRERRGGRKPLPQPPGEAADIAA